MIICSKCNEEFNKSIKICPNYNISLTEYISERPNRRKTLFSHLYNNSDEFNFSALIVVPLALFGLFLEPKFFLLTPFVIIYWYSIHKGEL